MRQGHSGSLGRTWVTLWGSARAAGAAWPAEGRAAALWASRPPRERGAAPRGASSGALAGALAGAGSLAASQATALARPRAGWLHRSHSRSVWKPWKRAQEDELTEESHLEAPAGHRPVRDGAARRVSARPAARSNS